MNRQTSTASSGKSPKSIVTHSGPGEGISINIMQYIITANPAAHLHTRTLCAQKYINILYNVIIMVGHCYTLKVCEDPK